MQVHGGRIVAEVLRSRGVEHLFTLSGGHLFSIYDGCKEEGIGLVDVRHEQTAAFAAEGFAKATREVGVAALTAGPGVTNGISAIAGAQANGSPLCVLGGRAPELRWGSGSLQEIDHLPFVSPLVKSAQTVKEPGRIAAVTAAALDLALGAPSGPTFVDYPLDVVFTEAEREVPALPAAAQPQPALGVEEAAALLAAAEVAFGSVFLREKAHEDERYKAAIQRTLEESLPVADGVLSPPWASEDDWELFGYTLEDTRKFAGTCLMRRLKVIGLG